ncbi:adenylate kinase 8 isoform X2 [Phascolarctos cinereus]|uniref:Adenylate kinase 8 isoform X2 n=1 Tax=Phascolarctos cinereus TaxID=38626 RepID=A0A6P5J6W5_PHACI|nr:adenylate kinase 8 isoform X2 [Phascolarctos cinereus]
MDATTAPHQIPVEMPQYGERHHIFEIMQVMLQELLIHQPEEPIQFMLNHLRRDNDMVPRIFILGPPASGKTTIAMWLCKHLNASLITKQNLIRNEFSVIAAKAATVFGANQGWILDGIPETREQALMIQTCGISPRHVIVLSAPDTVLIERNLGKRIDPYNGEVYHTTFDWPSDTEVQSRLKVPLGISEEETAKRLMEYHKNINRILPSYPKILKVISSDQPCVDVFYQALTYVQSQHRSNAPFTPKILLCGPTGSGKSLQAALLAQKYGIINVCCGHLLKEALASNSNIGEYIRPFFEQEMQVPDQIIIRVLINRLSKQDCIRCGWVLHGFPQDLNQATLLDNAGFMPNRVFFLNVPYDSVIERLTLRRTDPATGERYHLMYKPPPTMQIQKRLMQHPEDTEEKVKLKIDSFYRNSSLLEDYFDDVIYVNGDQDPYTVFEYIESGIILPLPTKVTL